MAIYTPRIIISLALKDAGIVGVGQTPLAEDINDAFTRLNWMLDQWAKSRWLVWHLVTKSVLSTGAQSYTVGPTGSDIVIDPRPDRLEAAFLRQLIGDSTRPWSSGFSPGFGLLQPPENNNIDYPLEIVEARETYNSIALKKLVSFPDTIFYDSDFPQGVIYPWPIPQAGIYEVHITVKATLNEFANLSSPITLLSPEYYQALHTNLAVILRDAYDLPLKPVLIQRAKVSLNTIRKANTQIARLKMPVELVRLGIYNIYSDQVR